MIRRSAPMRRTPLASGGGLQRKTPLVSRTGLQYRTPLAPVSAKRAVQNRQRQVVVSAMRLLCEGQCARCGRRDLPVRGHERLARAHGGDIVHPDCLLCDQCNGWCEDRPQTAAWTGWKVSPKWPHDPALSSSQGRDLAGNVVDFTIHDPAGVGTGGAA